MEIFLYAVIFIIGTVCGSFFTLAVYRIPLKKDITHERSFCPNCNHRLEFLDLIPVLSYVFLGGKCRYCKQKIRPRYLILELLTGFIFLLFAISLRIDLYNLQISKIVFLIYGLFYISTLFIIAGIDKENHLISRGVLVFGLVIILLYIIYLYILNVSIYKYVIYLILMFIFILIDIIKSRKNKKQNYSLLIFALCMYMASISSSISVLIGIIFSLLLIALKQIKIKNDKPLNYIKDNLNIRHKMPIIPIGYYLCLTNILIILIQNINVK